MEKSIDSFVAYLKEAFQLEDKDLRTYSPLTLAYIGDAIFDLVIRTILVKRGNCQPNKLQQRASRLVRASAQAEMIQDLMPFLTEEEIAVYKRGRNAKSYTKAKNATVSDYRKATGLEALMGYLYLEEDTKRIIELIHTGLEMAEERKAGKPVTCSAGEEKITGAEDAEEEEKKAQMGDNGLQEGGL